MTGRAMIETAPNGLDLLLQDSSRLAGRNYGLLAHQASLSRRQRLAHAELAAVGHPPAVLFGPEHGFYGVEQDMVAAADAMDPLLGVPVRSLYGDSEESLQPRSDAFEGLDLLVIDLQDVGARYYTFVATAVWSARVAVAAGCSVLVLDRPNPLGSLVEGNLPEPGFESFVGAFSTPVRHGLTLGELVLLEARRGGWEFDGSIEILCAPDWQRNASPWGCLEGTAAAAAPAPWVAPSPNMPSFAAATVYPGLCLIEATALSEGRGTTRPFQLIGTPGLEPGPLIERLQSELGERHPEVRFVPSLFRPQFQKHGGEICGGVELVVMAPLRRPFLFGLELLRAFVEEQNQQARTARGAPGPFAWRTAAYEFRLDHPALDLLCGSVVPREQLAAERVGPEWQTWLDSFAADEAAFCDECREREVLLYGPESAHQAVSAGAGS